MLHFLNKAALGVSSFAVLLMMLVGGLDVIGATFFNQPFPAAYEIIELLMALAVFLAISSLQARRMNIAVDVLSARMKPRKQRWFAIFATVLGAIFFGLMAWQGWAMALESLQVFEYTQGAYRIPVYPAKFAFAVGASLMVMQLARDLITQLRPPHSAEPPALDMSSPRSGNIQRF